MALGISPVGPPFPAGRGPDSRLTSRRDPVTGRLPLPAEAFPVEDRSVSHIVTIEAEARDPAAVASACRLGLLEPVAGTAKLFDGAASGLLAHPPGWRCSAVVEAATGKVRHDYFNGSWGGSGGDAAGPASSTVTAGVPRAGVSPNARPGPLIRAIQPDLTRDVRSDPPRSLRAGSPRDDWARARNRVPGGPPAAGGSPGSSLSHADAYVSEMDL